VGVRNKRVTVNATSRVQPYVDEEIDREWRGFDPRARVTIPSMRTIEKRNTFGEG
jgi:hypothetical protein